MSARLGWSLAGIVLAAVVVTIGLTAGWKAVIVFAAMWVAILVIARNLAKEF